MSFPASEDELTTAVDVSIVVPTYREVDNVRDLLPAIDRAMSRVSASYEVIIVDDDSGDGIPELVREKSNEYPVRIIIRTEERGLSSAVLRGFREADGSVLVCMDADLSHPPDTLPEMIQPILREKADFTIGSRYLEESKTDEKWGLLRWINSNVATLLARPFVSVSDPMSGFFALSRTVFESSDDLNPVGYKIALELLVKCNVTNLREVPIYFRQRKHGKSKLTFTEQLKYLNHIRRLANHRYGRTSQYIQFAGVGATGMVVDLALVNVLLLLLQLPSLVARAAGILTAMTWELFPEQNDYV